MVNDFIPASIFYEVAKPFIFISAILFIAIVVAVVLFFHKKYLPVIFLGCVAFILNQVFVHLC